MTLRRHACKELERPVSGRVPIPGPDRGLAKSDAMRPSVKHAEGRAPQEDDDSRKGNIEPQDN